VGGRRRGNAGYRRVFVGAAGLPAGTAQVTVAVRTLVPPRRSSAHRRTITTGDRASGISALISNKDELIAAAVGINNVGGFTGSYNAGLGGSAKVTMTGRTYDISGTADGFDMANPSFRTSGTFAIKVAC
jgi:hypothetical protein